MNTFNFTRDEIRALDLAFVLDTTGSMGPLLQAAREHMTALLSQLSSEANLRVGFVEYRDHPPQDKLLTRIHPFSSDLKQAQKVVAKFKADGGGDGPEAVFDGVVEATQMPWRAHARRIAVLIGDAPPHGVGASGDSFRGGCPCGETPDSVSARCEEARVTLYALGLLPGLEKHFGGLAAATGGQFWESVSPHYGRTRATKNGAVAPMERLKAILQLEAAHLEFDDHVWQQVEATPNALVEELATSLECGRGTIAASLARLGRRDLI